MNRLAKFKTLAVAITVIGLTIVSLVSRHPGVAAREIHKPAVASLARQSYRGLPVRLVIPAININTSVEYVGNNALGNMDTTKGSVDVAWYKYSALPGDPGSAVIAGHVVDANGQAGVFIDLGKLQKGDIVSVTDAKGLSVAFTVRLIQTYDAASTSNDIFNSKTGVHLNLITCSGDWDAASHHYLNRLVVFTDKTS